MKKTDKIIISVNLFLIIFAISYVAAKNVVAAAIIAFLLTVTVCVSFLKIANRYKKTKKISLSKTEDGLSFIGITAQTELFISALPPETTKKINDFCFSYDKNGKKIMVFPNYKFFPTSKDDIAKFFRTCKDNGVNDCIVLSRQSTRELLLFARGLPLNFKFLPTKAVRNFLVSRNLENKFALPEKPKVKTKKKFSKQFFRELIDGIISKEKAKYFLISGVGLVFGCLFTPLKIYYLVFAVITLSLSIVCYIKGEIY